MSGPTARRFAIPGALAIALLVALALDMGRGGLGQDSLTISLTLKDQLGRSTPFFICGENSTTKLTARLVITVPEGTTISPQATFAWKTPDGRLITQVNSSFTVIPPRTLVSEATVNANLSMFPPDERSYSVSASADEHRATLNFHICARPDRVILREDFQNRAPWTFPSDWRIESPGQGASFQYIEEIVFEGGNRVLRMASVQASEARLAHSINASSDHIQFSFKAKVWEEHSSNPTEPVVMCFGIVARGGRVALLNLGKDQVLPFGYPYAQQIWSRVDLFLDLGRSASGCCCYLDGVRVGTIKLPAMRPDEIDRIYFLLAGTSNYVAQLDEILFQEYRLNEGSRYYPFSSSLDVSPSRGQWFDPSSFVVRYSAEITPRIASNPYLQVQDLRIELSDSTQRLGIVGRTSWNGSTDHVSSCEVFTHTYSSTVPASLINSGTDGFDGDYLLKSAVDYPSLTLASETAAFHVDDPLEAYFSLWRAGPKLPSTTLKRAPMNISVNVEFDPRPAAGHMNEPPANKTCFIDWTDPNGRIIRNESAPIRSHSSYPSNKSWAFDSLPIYANSTLGTYTCLVKAACNSGYEVAEAYRFTLVVGEEFLVAVGSLSSFLVAFELRARCKARGQPSHH